MHLDIGELFSNQFLHFDQACFQISPVMFFIKVVLGHTVNYKVSIEDNHIDSLFSLADFIQNTLNKFDAGILAVFGLICLFDVEMEIREDSNLPSDNSRYDEHK